jgi:glycosyltransferase involved in cell wall biosynthesis
MCAAPEITVVIPTHARAELLARAIRSVLAQTFENFEIVVVLDGEDPASLRTVERFLDSRIRCVTLEANSGGSSARNAGVAAAHGEWIAFLDDDDEFLPRKLELQLAAAKSYFGEAALIVCRAIVRGDSGDVTWPERFPGAGESLSDYLFCRRKFRQGEGFLQTSTYFVSRSLALRIPFRTGLSRHQDWDWILRLESEGQARVVAVPEPLAIYYHGGAGPAVSRGRGWRTSLDWGREAVLPRSRRAYSYFLATQCVSRFGGDDCWSWRNFRELAREYFGAGRAEWMSAILLGMFWMRAMLRSVRAAGAGISRETKSRELTAPGRTSPELTLAEVKESAFLQLSKVKGEV